MDYREITIYDLEAYVHHVGLNIFLGQLHKVFASCAESTSDFDVKIISAEYENATEEIARIRRLIFPAHNGG